MQHLNHAIAITALTRNFTKASYLFLPVLTRLVREQIRNIEAVEVTGKVIEVEDLHSNVGVEQTLEVGQSLTGGELDPAEDEIKCEVVVLHSLEALLELRKRFL